MKSEKRLREEITKLEEMVWWNRHEALKDEERSGEGGEEEAEIQEEAAAAAKRIEEKYGKEALILDDHEYGELLGKLVALRWALRDEEEWSNDLWDT